MSYGHALVANGCGASTTNGSRGSWSRVPPSPKKYSRPTHASVSLFLCGVYWTKFECISSKILKRATNRTLRVRGRLNLKRTLRLRGQAPRTRSRTRACKPKHFLAFFSGSSPHPSAERRKIEERKCFGLLRRFRTSKRASFDFIIFSRSFLRSLRRPEAQYNAVCARAQSDLICACSVLPFAQPNPAVL